MVQEDSRMKIIAFFLVFVAKALGQDVGFASIKIKAAKTHPQFDSPTYHLEQSSDSVKVVFSCDYVQLETMILLSGRHIIFAETHVHKGCLILSLEFSGKGISIRFRCQEIIYSPDLHPFHTFVPVLFGLPLTQATLIYFRLPHLVYSFYALQYSVFNQAFQKIP